jgi:hypothetical protein
MPNQIKRKSLYQLGEPSTRLYKGSRFAQLCANVAWGSSAELDHKRRKPKPPIFVTVFGEGKIR